MIKQMEVGFCWGLMLHWTFGMDFECICTGKVREECPGFFQYSVDKYIKL